MKKRVIIVLISTGLMFFDISGARINANPSDRKEPAARPFRLFARPGESAFAVFPATAPVKENMGGRILTFRTAGGILTDGSPYPRVITPNADGVNDYVFFFFETTDAAVDGKIYDLNSAFVAGMKPGPVQDASLVWDGKDDRGRVVPMGVYLYKVTIGNESVTGTIVVAR